MPRSAPEGPPTDGRFLRAGLQAARAVAAAPGPAEAYKTVLPVLHTEISASVARLWLRDSGGEQLVCVDWSWGDPRFREAAESPFGVTTVRGEGLAGTCWQEGESIALRIADRPELFPNRQQLAGAGIDSAVAVPLRGISEMVGVLTLYYLPGEQPVPAKLSQLEVVGAALGSVLEAKQHDAVAREQIRRDQLLLSASSAVSEARGYHETLRMLAASSVPGLADLCLIDLVTDDGSLERVAAVHADPAKAALVDELKNYYAPRIGSTHPAGQVTGSARSVWSATMSDEFLRETTQDERHLEIVTELGFASYLSVPLLADAEILGVMTLVSAGSGRVFTAEDVATGERMAAQVAGTVARARDRELERQRSVEVAARSRALVELGTELSGAQIVEEALAALLASPVCSLGAQAARIGLLDESGTMLHVTFAGEIESEIVNRYHVVGLDAAVPIATVVNTGRPLVIPDMRRVGRRYAALSAATAHLIRAIVLEPLRAEDGRALGAFGLSWPEPRSFSADELELLAAVGSALSRAVARILVARREHEVAASLQERLLALDAGSAAAVVSAIYRPAGGAMRVGGDWYTARVLDGEERIGVSVGDVVGHGLDAVATMSQLRSALEAAALAESDPADVLALLDRYAQGVPGAACATASYARVDVTAGRVHYACAGHPYPLLLTPDGEARFLTDGRSAPLGIGPSDGPSSSGTAELPAGSLLVLYSDGLIERHGESLQAGLDRLAQAAAGCAQLPAGAVCAELLAGLADESGYTDDVVVVALRPVGTTPACHVDCLAADFTQIAPARRRLRAWLSQFGLGQPLAYELLLAVGEAVNNAIEHAGVIEPRRFVAIEAFADEQRIEVSVTDSGRWTKDSAVSRHSDERGWGLTLIHRLSARVDTVRGSLGTRVTMTFERRPQADGDPQASGVSAS